MGMLKAFYFNEISSLSNGLVVEHKHILSAPEPDLLSYEIPGRDGTVYLDTGRRKNIDISYDTYLHVQKSMDKQAWITGIKQWLLSNPGHYFKLEDDFDLDHYRMAAYVQGLEVQDEWRWNTRQTPTFSCKPYRYLRNGDQRVTVSSTSSIELYNPTSFEALPEIVVFYGSFNGTGIIDISYEDGTSYNGSFVGMDNSGYAFLIDSEDQIFRNGDTQDSAIYPGAQLDIFPVLKPGKNTVSINISGASQWGVKPRWREL